MTDTIERVAQALHRRASLEERGVRLTWEGRRTNRGYWRRRASLIIATRATTEAVMRRVEDKDT